MPCGIALKRFFEGTGRATPAVALGLHGSVHATAFSSGEEGCSESSSKLLPWKLNDVHVGLRGDHAAGHRHHRFVERT
jgi:hypothetical protein